MTSFGSDKVKNEVLLVARLLLVALFLITGLLIPVQAAHHNEMMSPAVTE